MAPSIRKLQSLIEESVSSPLGPSLVKGEGDQPYSNLNNDASALCVPRVNISLPAPRAACQSQ